MSWFTKTISSSVGRKVIMSLTGIFLILFLIEHLIGNLLLLKHDGGLAFNEFAHFMKYNPLIQVGEVVLFLGFLFHIIDGIILVGKNRSARPISYAVSNKSIVTSWTSKFMGPFGIVILVFLIVHLYSFFRFKYFVEPPMVEGTDIADLAIITYTTFQSVGYVIFYVISMLVVAFHLNHGFQSAFQTLGINHVKYTPLIKKIGVLYSILIPLGMAIIPVIIYFGSYNN
ncbi:MAG: succinate dehydrogenase cytochrome b subunit [Cyclobacteriaceae bacterium]|nr:succinate dehydrogenase cytochrome b subunit [Cyclobacteriaceae bacterium]